MSRFSDLAIAGAVLLALSGAAVADPWPIDNTGATHRIWHAYGQWQESGGIHLHEGIDLPHPDANDVKAVRKGKVVNIHADADPYYSYVTIADDGSPSTGWGYVHIKAKPGLSVDDVVNVGDVIGTITTAGGVLPHLHLERDSNANGGWPNDGGGIEHLLDDPLLYLSPSTDSTFPTIDAGFKYRRAEDEHNDGSPKYMTALKCGKAWIGSRAPNGSGNVDVIVSAYDKFGSFADKLSVQRITYHALGRLGDNTPFTLPLVTFSGTGAGDFAQQETDNFNKLFRDPTFQFAQDIYENDNVANSEEEGPFWYIVTNQDNDTITEAADANWFWDTDGIKAEAWNDQLSSDERAANNAKSKFRDDYYDIYINVRDEANNVSSKVEKVVLDNWKQTVATSKFIYLLGEWVPVASGSQHQASDTVPEYVVKSYSDCSAISSIVASGTTTSNADGELAFSNIWLANQTGWFYMLSDYDHDGDYVSVLDAVDPFIVIPPKWFHVIGDGLLSAPPYPTPPVQIAIAPEQTSVPTEILSMSLTGATGFPAGQPDPPITVQVTDTGGPTTPGMEVNFDFFSNHTLLAPFPEELFVEAEFELVDLTVGPGTLLPQEGGGYFDIQFQPGDPVFDVFFDVEVPTVGRQRFWYRGWIYDSRLLTFSDVYFGSIDPESNFDMMIGLGLLGDPFLIPPGSQLFSISLRGGTVPEPATMSLLVLGAVAVAARRRRRSIAG